jgi:two-component system, OmpR family, phosphate regulon sensor histidine kinase PhoR
MKNSTLRWLILIGMLAILSNFGIQLHLLHMAFSEGQKKFSQTVHIALLEVVRKMYGHNVGNTAETGPVKKVSNDYYVVDVNDHIRADILEYYLKSELRRFGIDADFEYGIYDCETDRMVYGNYINLSNKKDEIQQGYLAKYPDLVYYFGIRFPNQANYVIGTLKIWIILTSVSLLILLFFVFVIFTVLRQKRLSELQHDFVNNMTHEFKTPITSTKIALEYLRNSDIIKADERFPKYIEMMGAQMDHLNNHVERILEISRMEKRLDKLQTRKIDLVQLVERVADTFIEPQRNFIFLFSERPVVIVADEVHLTNVVISLIDNAIKYSKPETNIELSVSIHNAQIIFSIKDEGDGIDKKQFRRVFQQFYRVPTGDVHNVKGFGLGLYYVKHICDRHKWKIKLQSKSGEGTTFAIYIPALKK